jgi:hypothetical protein
VLFVILAELRGAVGGIVASKNTAPSAGRTISDREFELLLRRAAEFCKMRQSRLLKKLKTIRKAPVQTV